MAISPLSRLLDVPTPGLFAAARKEAASRASQNEDPTDKAIKELQRQLRLVQRQMERVRNSGATPEQKASQLQALNAQAATIQGSIQKLMGEKLAALAASAAARG
ncbi:hypothetical protein [Bordetella genomosp. 13]|uniref:FlxA-like protein n=1 Tax=Bordetella genomosp. 13 TaxID=463040 RepID=A0A1W6ZD37_9BORD|nr:hypothetical protein [Bordetella genomosp. 13]ARP95293.1 hypothetical protein CAL15_13400 [Bordetella genomosp. 13]